MMWPLTVEPGKPRFDGDNDVADVEEDVGDDDRREPGGNAQGQEERQQ